MAKTMNISTPNFIDGVPLHKMVQKKVKEDFNKKPSKYNCNNISKLTNRMWKLFLRGSLDNHLEDEWGKL